MDRLTTFRKYDHDLHGGWLHSLWHSTLDPKWALSAGVLRQRIASSTLSLVAEHDGVPVAFCAAGHAAFGPAGLLVILVDPRHQRQGIGSRLLQALESALLRDGVTELELGYSRVSDYFWQGVPVCEDVPWNFFSKRGWQEDDRSSDLLIDLTHYQTPSWILDRLHASRVLLVEANPGTRSQILQFEQRHFPKWLSFYEDALLHAREHDVLVAQTSDGAIVGTVLLNSEAAVPWSALSSGCGSFGVLGVSDEQRGRGVGLALAGRAAQIIQARGRSACFIGWTGLVSWYGKLGAAVWTEYRMSRKPCVLPQPAHAPAATHPDASAAPGTADSPQTAGYTRSFHRPPAPR